MFIRGDFGHFSKMKCIAKNSTEKSDPHPFSITAIEAIERNRNHFAIGLCPCKLFWIFLFSGAFGVIIETVYWLIRTGRIESRATFVWAPLNMVYGVGGVLMTVVLYYLRKHPLPAVLAAGMGIGCLVEFFCSLIQESVFSSVSWQYSDMMDIQGRTNLKYSFFWGILAVFWLKIMLPSISLILLKIPKKAGKTVTAILCIFMAINFGVTFFAVRRWAERQIRADQRFEIQRIMDRWFPDEYMEQQFPNLRFVHVQTPNQYP